MGGAKSDLPKKALSPYILFTKDHRARLANEVKEANPDADKKRLFALTAVALAAAWKDVSDSDKKKYEALNAKDKLRYAEEMKNYDGPLPSRKSKKGAKDKKGGKKKNDGPKRASTAWILFSTDNRSKISDEIKESNPDVTRQDLFKLVAAALSEAWKALPDADRAPYEARAAKDKARYETERAAYLRANPKPKASKSKSKSKASPKKKKKQSSSSAGSSSSDDSSSDSGSDSSSGSGTDSSSSSSSSSASDSPKRPAKGKGKAKPKKRSSSSSSSSS